MFATADLFPRVTFVGTIALEAVPCRESVRRVQTLILQPRISWAALDLGRVYARIKPPVQAQRPAWLSMSRRC